MACVVPLRVGTRKAWPVAFCQNVARSAAFCQKRLELRHFATPAAAESPQGNVAVSSVGKTARWDFAKGQPVFDKYVEFKFSEEDIQRFGAERLKFRDDPRLTLPEMPPSPDELEWWEKFRLGKAVCRIDDEISGIFQDLIQTRLEDKELMARFGLEILEGKTLEKPLHNTGAVPREGAYFRMLQQTYWLALHVWFVHSKQHLLQEKEGLFGSALCAIITRRTFEWAWLILRLWLKQEDVPAMSITSEMEHFMEYVFGFLAALDEAFVQEAPNGTAKAVALKDSELENGMVGLLPCVKQVLWQNVYFGAVPHEDPKLSELAVYLVRQRLAVEAMSRNDFFTGRMTWADFPARVGSE